MLLRQFLATSLCQGNWFHMVGEPCPDPGATASPSDPNRSLFLTVRTPKASLVGEKTKNLWEEFWSAFENMYFLEWDAQETHGVRGIINWFSTTLTNLLQTQNMITLIGKIVSGNFLKHRNPNHHLRLAGLPLPITGPFRRDHPDTTGHCQTPPAEFHVQQFMPLWNYTSVTPTREGDVCQWTA